MSSVELWESTPRDHHPQRLAENFSPSPTSGEQAITQGRTRITHGRQLYNCWGGAGGQNILPGKVNETSTTGLLLTLLWEPGGVAGATEGMS